MIIDEILDRYDAEKRGEPDYDPRDFYLYLLETRSVFGKMADDISRAMDYGEEDDVRQALADYVIKNEYNPLIVNYINSRDWLVPDRTPHAELVDILA